MAIATYTRKILRSMMTPVDIINEGRISLDRGLGMMYNETIRYNYKAVVCNRVPIFI